MTVIRVGRAPEKAIFNATYLNGHSGAPVQVQVEIDEGRKALVAPGLHWPLAEIREIPDQGGRDIMVLRLASDPVSRLVMQDRALQPRLPNRRRRAPVTRRGRLFAWALAAVASVALIIFVLVPVMADQLADFIPPEGEQALGDVTLDQIRSALNETDTPIGFCEAPQGLHALARIEQRLVSSLDLPAPLNVHVLDHPMVNAFALPGGHIVFFNGLIDAAETPEELAAVFAHEIGHVVSRDPTRHALRSAGSIGVLGLLFGDFAGGAIVLFLAEQLIEAQYSQQAEHAADQFATELMLQADLPPDALADMFERFQEIGGDTQGFVAHFMSHPELGDRIEAARQAMPDGFTPVPLLSAQEWRNLKGICQ